MSDSQKSAAPERRARRAFLKGVLLSTGGAAALAVNAAAPAPARAEVEEAASPDKAGYRETDHVRAYYATARF